MANGAKKRTYYPQKTFDDDLNGLVNLFKEKAWSFSGVDNAQLAKDTIDQRSEREQHDALEVKYLAVHESFGVAQEQRHERFATALKAARGAFGNDKAIMAQLDKFKRSVKARKNGGEEK